MPGKDGMEMFRIDCAALDKLKQARFVFGPSCLESDGGKVLDGENQRRRSFHPHCHGISKRLLDQRARGREKLHWPSGYDDILALDDAAPGRKIVEDRLQTQQTIAGLWSEHKEDIEIKRRNRLKIKCSAHRSPDGIALDNAVFFQSIDSAITWDMLLMTLLPRGAMEWSPHLQLCRE